jgi:hypothetical protein
MSTALTLPYVWAATNGSRPVESYSPLPVGGLAFYRKHTESVLRKYMRVSLDMGRVPCVLGKVVFRGRVSSYRVRNFEDAVIFVIDVERCLTKLDQPSQELIARIALQEHTHSVAAQLTGQSLRSVSRKYGEVLDRLTVKFLKSKLLVVRSESGCQEEDIY